MLSNNAPLSNGATNITIEEGKTDPAPAAKDLKLRMAMLINESTLCRSLFWYMIIKENWDVANSNIHFDTDDFLLLSMNIFRLYTNTILC